MYEPYESYNSETAQVTEPEVAAYLAKVMGWMCVGLLTTLASAIFCISNASVAGAVYSFSPVVFILQIGVVVGLSAGLNRFSSATATVLFLLYSALTGLTISAIYFIYELSSIIMVFGMAALLFFTMCMYGLITRRDLSRVGSIAFMGLIAIIIAGLVNIWLRSEMIFFLVNVVGLLVFVALTAYDVQRIKAMYVSVRGAADNYGSVEIDEQAQKLAVYGALSLYLDFINIFLKLLMLFGRRR